MFPCPDLNDPYSLEQGFLQRIGRKMPEDRSGFCGKLRTFTKSFIEARRIRKVSSLSDLSVEKWLTTTSYNEARKEQLRQCLEDVSNLFERNDKNELLHFRVKMFAKEEQYVEMKHFRGIYAREDVAKCVFGPYFKAIETILYGEQEFIKHIPVRDRPDYIMDHVYDPSYVYVSTDYSSFECHFSAEIMDACEFQLYEHCLGDLPGGEFIVSLMREVIMGKNRILSKQFSATIGATRMSGEMNTSLGNGFSNLMFMGTICGFIPRGVVEGDDGLFAFKDYPDMDEFDRCGLILKFEKHAELSTASFCGMVFDPEDRQPIGDPHKIINKLGFVTRRYLAAKPKKLNLLQRCKALSMGHAYPACPIVTAFCSYLVRTLPSLKQYEMIRYISTNPSMSLYEKDVMISRIKAGYKREVPTTATRLLFERVYGISVDVQLRIEKILDDKQDLGPVELPFFVDLASRQQRFFYSQYAVAPPAVSAGDVSLRDLLFSPSVLPRALVENYGDYG